MSGYRRDILQSLRELQEKATPGTPLHIALGRAIEEALNGPEQWRALEQTQAVDAR